MMDNKYFMPRREIAEATAHEGDALAAGPTEEDMTRDATLWTIETQLRSAVEQGIGLEEIVGAIERGLKSKK